jgi:chromosome segregation ATPase
MLGRSMRRLWPLLGALSLLVLAGCAQTDDPRHGGFVTGVSNLMTGGYDKRLQREQATLDQESGKQAALTSRAELLQRQRRDLEDQVASLSTDVASLDRQLRRLRSQLASSRDSVKRRQVEVALLRLEAVNKSLRSQDLQNQSVEEATEQLREMSVAVKDISAVADASL